MKYFFWYCLNTTVRKFNNTNIGAVNVIQKKFVYLHEIGEQIKRSPYFSFYLPTIQLIISTRGKSYEDIYHSPPHASVIIGNILIRIIRFSATISLLPALYVGTIQICRNLTEHCSYLISATFVIWQIQGHCSPFQSPNMLPFHIRQERLKLIY